MRLISTLLVILNLVLGVSVLSAKNVIKKGNSTVNIVYSGDIDKFPAIEASVFASTPFDENNMSQEYVFGGCDNGLTANIPLLTQEAIAVIRITMPDGMPCAIGLINIGQDKPLDITATYFAENDSMTFTMSNTDGMNRYSIGNDENNKSIMICQACMMICDLYSAEEIVNESGLLSADDYSSWQRYSEKIEPVRQLEYEMAGIAEIDVPEAQPWLENCVRRYCICQWPMNFVRNASYFGVDTENPPLEYYKFLNTLDVSEAMLDYYPDLPPFYLLKQILLKVPGVEPIGEKTVSEWKSQTGRVLCQVIDQPLDFLLDMLAAASYVIQLRDDNQPLSAEQKENISAGMAEDLAAYLFEMNDALESSLAAGVNFYDLSAEPDFSLDDFINANYPDKPVVVDMWNTWCQPCLWALSETEPIKHLPEFSDEVFLYLSDVSSQFDQWQSLATMIGGEQVRLSEEAMTALFEHMQSEVQPAFPTFLFYDRKHDLKHTIVAFPGQEEYIRLLDEINE